MSPLFGRASSTNISSGFWAWWWRHPSHTERVLLSSDSVCNSFNGASSNFGDFFVWHDFFTGQNSSSGMELGHLHTRWKPLEWSPLGADQLGGPPQQTTTPVSNTLKYMNWPIEGSSSLKGFVSFLLRHVNKHMITFWSWLWKMEDIHSNTIKRTSPSGFLATYNSQTPQITSLYIIEHTHIYMLPLIFTYTT